MSPLDHFRLEEMARMQSLPGSVDSRLWFRQNRCWADSSLSLAPGLQRLPSPVVGTFSWGPTGLALGLVYSRGPLGPPPGLYHARVHHCHASMRSDTADSESQSSSSPLVPPLSNLLSTVPMWELPLDDNDTCLAGILEVSTLLHDHIRSPQFPVHVLRQLFEPQISLGAHYSAPTPLVALPPPLPPALRIQLSSGTIPLHVPLRVFHTRQTPGYPYPYPFETRTPVEGHGFRRVRVRVPLRLPGGYP
jgi:hypothetical protein